MRRIAAWSAINKYEDSPLRGCLADVDRMMLRLGYFDRLMNAVDEQATHEGIRELWKEAVMDAAPGDAVGLGYSGHGSIIPMATSSSGFPSHLVQVICPYDYQEHWDAPFDDGVLHSILKLAKPGVAITLVLDACHTGGGWREALQAPGRFVLPPVDKLANSPRMPIPINRFGLKQAAGYLHADKSMKHLAWSACRADQTAADAHIDGPGGAFTVCWDLALVNAAGQSNASVAAMTNQLLQQYGFEQIAQLEGPQRMIDALPFAPL